MTEQTALPLDDYDIVLDASGTRHEHAHFPGRGGWVAYTGHVYDFLPDCPVLDDVAITNIAQAAWIVIVGYGGTGSAWRRVLVENDAQCETLEFAPERNQSPPTWNCFRVMGSTYERHRSAFTELGPSATEDLAEELSRLEEKLKVLSFLKRLERLSTDDAQVDDAIDEVIEYFDAEMHADNFERCNRTLELSVAEHIGVETLLSMLSMTFAVKDRLPARIVFMEKVRNRLLRERGKESTDELLYGLE